MMVGVVQTHAHIPFEVDTLQWPHAGIAARTFLFASCFRGPAGLERRLAGRTEWYAGSETIAHGTSLATVETHVAVYLATIKCFAGGDSCEQRFYGAADGRHFVNLHAGLAGQGEETNTLFLQFHTPYLIFRVFECVQAWVI
jgi:hypothetical protein